MRDPMVVVVEFLVLLAGFVLVSGGWSYLLAVGGVRIVDTEHRGMLASPLAMLFTAGGVSGLFILRRAATVFPSNPSRAKTLCLLGVVLLMGCYVFLDGLFWTVYT